MTLALLPWLPGVPASSLSSCPAPAPRNLLLGGCAPSPGPLHSVAPQLPCCPYLAWATSLLCLWNRAPQREVRAVPHSLSCSSLHTETLWPHGGLTACTPRPVLLLPLLNSADPSHPLNSAPTTEPHSWTHGLNARWVSDTVSEVSWRSSYFSLGPSEISPNITYFTDGKLRHVFQSNHTLVLLMCLPPPPVSISGSLVFPLGTFCPITALTPLFVAFRLIVFPSRTSHGT